MTIFDALIRRIAVVLQDAKLRPSANRVFILSGPPLSGKTHVAKRIAVELKGTYMDLLKDRMHLLIPKLGSYSPEDFKQNVRTWAEEARNILVVDEIEALLDTWTIEQQEDWLKLISGLGGRMANPVLITCRFQLPYEELGIRNIFKMP